MHSIRHRVRYVQLLLEALQDIPPRLQALRRYVLAGRRLEQHGQHREVRLVLFECVRGERREGEGRGGEDGEQTARVRCQRTARRRQKRRRRFSVFVYNRFFPLPRSTPGAPTLAGKTLPPPCPGQEDSPPPAFSRKQSGPDLTCSFFPFFSNKCHWCSLFTLRKRD